MKSNTRILCCIVLALLTAVGAEVQARVLSPLEAKAKKEIFESVRKMSTQVRDLGDGDLMIVVDGTRYVIGVESLDSSVLYLSVGAQFTFGELKDELSARCVAEDSAAGKPVYCSTDGKTLLYTCEMYALSAKPFIDVLPEMLLAIASSHSYISEHYDEISDPVTQIEIVDTPE